MHFIKLLKLVQHLYYFLNFIALYYY